MESVVSAISGQFSKSLILGTFLPSLLFVVLGVFLVVPLFPSDLQMLQELAGATTQAVLAVSFVTVVLTGLLYNLNATVIRFYEGYTWRRSLIGRLFTSHYRKLLLAALSLRPRLQDVQDGMPAPPDGGDASAKREARKKLNEELGEARTRVGRLVLNEFPDSPGSVLPTRLGNVIRSFEVYPRRQYRMSAITLWPRLVAKVEKEYGEQVDNAKTSFDFMINCSLLSFLMALLILFVGLWYPVVFAAPRLWVTWLFKVALFLALSYAFYLSSIGRAVEWGELVKGAFDLYRRALLAQLGYEGAPSSIEGERRLWDLISQQLIYGDARRGPYLPPFKETTTSASCVPETLRLRVTRGVEANSAGGVHTVTLRVYNPDGYGRAARSVVLTDALPEGFAYVWNSALVLEGAEASTVTRTPVHHNCEMVSGTNTMRFEVGRLAAGASFTVRYEAAKCPNDK